MNTSTLRPELTDFSSIVCLKAIITGMEDLRKSWPNTPFVGAQCIAPLHKI